MQSNVQSKCETLIISFDPMVKSNISSSSKKQKRKVFEGFAYIQAGMNNTIVTITNPQGDVICWASSGVVGFKGSRKSTPFAARAAAAAAAKQSMTQGMQQVKVLVKGPGLGRETAIRGLQDAGLRVMLIRDITPLPHNGCRPPSKRRI
jgi:small subunit ribosomal protein S11